VPVLCDFETHQKWLFSDGQKSIQKFECSPEIEGTIHFSGHSLAQYSMDGRPKFWALNFYNRTKNERYGCGPGVFETKAEARACLERYISKGCPLPGTIEWVQFR
jgi:hypothetical protein